MVIFCRCPSKVLYTTPRNPYFRYLQRRLLLVRAAPGPTRLVEVGIERENLLCLSSWPDATGLADAEADAEIGWLVKLVSEVRSVRSEMNVPAGAKIPLVLVGAGKATRAPISTRSA